MRICSRGFAFNTDNMKKSILTLAMAAICGSGMAQQLPNVGFEKWKTTCGQTFQASTKGGKEAPSEKNAAGLRTRPGVEPEEWNGSNVDQIVVFPGTEKNLVTEQKVGKNKYLKLANRWVGVGTIGATAPAYVTLGTPWVYACSEKKEQDGGTYGGINFTHRPDAIKGRFRRTNVSGKSEKAHIIAYLWKGTFSSKIGKNHPGKISKGDVDRAIMGKSNAGKITGNGKLIASADYEFATTKNNDWEEIEVPINYKDFNSIPEKMNIIVSSADYWTRSNIVETTNGKDGSVLDVDDLQFVYYSTLNELSVNGQPITLEKGVFNYTIDEAPIEGKTIAKATSNFANVDYTYSSNAVTIKVTANDGSVSTYTVSANGKSTPSAEEIAKTYHSQIDVTMSATSSSLNEISIEANADNTINFILNGFSFSGLGNVGNIRVINVPLSWNGDNLALKSKQVISIDGNLTDGLNLKNMPVTLEAEVTPEGKLSANLNIEWTEPSSQQITPIVVTVKEAPIAVESNGTNLKVNGTMDDDTWNNLLSTMLDGVTSVDLTDTNITSVDFANDASLYDNIIYYVSNDIVGTNIVSNNNTECISIIDGIQFGIPTAFTAESVSYDREFQTGDYVSSFILPFGFDVPAGVTVAELSTVNGSSLVFKPVTKTVANKPYIVKTNDANFINSLTNVEVKPTVGESLTTTVDGVNHVGSYTSQEVSNVYGYANGKFVKVNSGTVNPFRTYITYNGTAAAPMSFNVEFAGEVTGINNAEVITNNNNKVYNLQGIHMNNNLNTLPKGVYVVGGKKIIK